MKTSIGLCCFFTLLLVACGGGDDKTATLTVGCSGAHCGAVDSHTYGGSGIGLWHHVNGKDRPVDVSVDLTGLTGHSLRLVSDH